MSTDAHRDHDSFSPQHGDFSLEEDTPPTEAIPVSRAPLDQPHPGPSPVALSGSAAAAPPQDAPTPATSQSLAARQQGRLATREDKRAGMLVRVVRAGLPRGQARRDFDALVTLYKMQEMHGQPRPESSAGLAHLETMVLAQGKEGGDRVVQTATRQVSALADKLAENRAERAEALSERSSALEAHVPNPDGGTWPASRALASASTTSGQVAKDTTEDGSKAHLRAPAWMRRTAPVLALADLALLVWFWSGLTNTDWANPLGMPLLAAVLISLLFAGVGFVGLAVLGEHLNLYRHQDGHISLHQLAPQTWAGLVLGGLYAVLVAAFMFWRIRDEALAALGEEATVIALVAGLVMAAISLLMSYVMVAVHATDGSSETRRADQQGHPAAKAVTHQQAAGRKVARLDAKALALVERAESIRAEAIVRAGRCHSAAQTVIEAARGVAQATNPAFAAASDKASDPNAQEVTTTAAGYRVPANLPQVDRRGLTFLVQQMRAAVTETTPVGQAR